MITDSAIRRLNQEIGKSLEANSDPAYLEDIKRFAPGSGRVIGVRVPVLRMIVKAFKNEHKELTSELAYKLLTEFCTGRCREEILVGVFLVASFSRSVSTDMVPSLWRRYR